MCLTSLCLLHLLTDLSAFSPWNQFSRKYSATYGFLAMLLSTITIILDSFIWFWPETLFCIFYGLSYCWVPMGRRSLAVWEELLSLSEVLLHHYTCKSESFQFFFERVVLRECSGKFHKVWSPWIKAFWYGNAKIEVIIIIQDLYGANSLCSTLQH